MGMQKSGLLSIIIPCFNEENNIEILYREIMEHTRDSGFDTEIVFVDDGSTDRSFEKIKMLASANQGVSGISFSKNFGKTMALLAGLRQSTGDPVITMDADGQHPASLIPELLARCREGYRIVNTRRTDKTHRTGRRAFSRWYYGLINFLSDVKIEPLSSDFRLMSRQAVEAFLSMEERDRYTNGLVSWMGFRQTSIAFEAPRRRSGKSSFSARMLVRLGLDGITSFSSRPLRISFALGLIILVLDIVYGTYALLNYFFGQTTPGWTSMMFTILFLGGIQLVSIGIIGEYIGRLFNESKKRPHYFIQDRC